MKKNVYLILFAVLAFNCFGQTKIEKFIKGNIAEKTAAVRESSGSDAVWLCNKAFSMVLESKTYLEEDRELDGLAVAAVLSYPQDYLQSLTDQGKERVIKDFISLFDSFKTSPTVQIAVISKLTQLSKDANIQSFVKFLNVYLYSSENEKTDAAVFKSALNFLAGYGNNESFIVCYNLWASGKFAGFNNDFEKVIVSLIPQSMNEALTIASGNNIERISAFFRLLEKEKAKINENFLSEIAEKILSGTLIIMRDSQVLDENIIGLQISAVKVLKRNRWTRASAVLLTYFDVSSGLYGKNYMDENSFITVITSLYDVSPFGAVSPLIEYLESLNRQVEAKQKVSEAVVLAVINTLGAIGDKSAFDSLLSVTYYNYPQTVLAAAREALSGLKW